MGRRLDLHHRLKKVFEEATHQKSENPTRVWFQPESTVKLVYPCIIYKLSDMPPTYANNNPYRLEHEYELTVIDRDPTSPLRERVAMLPQCRCIAVNESDNLHQYVFHIYD